MMEQMGPNAPFVQPNNNDNDNDKSNYNDSAFPEYSQLGEKASTLPRLMKGLRERVASELYNVGEELFGVVDSDFRESVRGGKSRNSNPVTDIERWQFKKTLQRSGKATLRWLLLIYLRTYDTLEDMLAEKKRSEEDQDFSRCGPGQFYKSTKSKITSTGKSSGSGSGISDPNAYSIQTPDSILRERMHGLLEDVKNAWETQRRDINKVGMGSLLHEELGESSVRERRKVVKRPFHRTEKRRTNHACHAGCEICSSNRNVNDGGAEGREDERRTKLNFLDSGAGPREFWSTVSPSITYHESQGGEIDVEQVEQHMWRLVLLVRCQDRERGLRLQRHESQRKLLDLRLYELILLYMR